MAVLGCDVYGHIVCCDLCLKGIFCQCMCYSTMYMGAGYSMWHSGGFGNLDILSSSHKVQLGTGCCCKCKLHVSMKGMIITINA